MRELLKKSEKFRDKKNNFFIQNVLEVIKNIGFAFLQNNNLVIKEKNYITCL